MGVDVLSPTDVERLPDVALDELARMYGVIEETLTWPSQLGLTIGRMIPKKASGDRVIGLLTM
eukprot:3872610-Pyramimonas_sp.AAC.1